MPHDTGRFLRLPLDANDELGREAYKQNFETFRALNALMWQIPLIAMTLTGGLWFGVSKVDDNALAQIGLLILAASGNLGLVFVLIRLRYIMGRYLEWLKQAYPVGYVAAPGSGWTTQNERVAGVFRILLLIAALISLVLGYGPMATMLSSVRTKPADAAVAFYDEHARRLANGYESLDPALVHPELFQMLAGPPKHVLDVGAGTGRDAAAIAELGHAVIAIEPSETMLRLARNLHPNRRIQWVKDSLPDLASVSDPADAILLSAVWMHLAPKQRPAAMRRISALLKKGGFVYLTLRVGPADPERAIFAVDDAEVKRLAVANRMTVQSLGSRPDLLGRADVSWRTLVLTKS